MGDCEKEIELLRKLWDKNLFDERVYINATMHSKNLFIKSFFNKLRYRKHSFGLKIRNQISNLEKELIISGKEIEEKSTDTRIEKNISLLPLFRFEKDELIKECYRREKANLKHCNDLLSQLYKGYLRELLLSQIHEIRLSLHEIKSMGIKTYEESEEEVRTIS